MLRSHWIVGCAALLIGCGNSTSTTGTGTGGSKSGTEPPPRPTGAMAGDSSGPKALAITKIFIGTTDRMGNASSTAYQQYGYDLDGMITTTDFSKHCTPNHGAAPKNVFVNGPNGVDNSFGKNLLPIITSAAGQGTDIQASLNGAIGKGSFTIIVDMPNLGTSTDYTPLTAYLLGGKNGTCSGGTCTSWQLVPELLNAPKMQASDAAVQFMNSYLTKNTWVSGDKGTVNLSLAVAGFNLNLTIASAVISMELGSDHNTATNGIIAGVLNTEDFITQLTNVIGAFQSSLCNSSTLDSILNQIRQASDILHDGTQDPTKVCDGISIGLGFEAANTMLGTVAPPAMPQQNPCMTTSSTSAGTGTTSSASGSSSTTTTTSAGGG